ncbi:hypothetical protein OEZ85_000881 [Tetradesmus obliquus]|uniref:MHD1 domain-containing protein n=1 Tax=Tetradesmus obliquus TaxID=3088 RepID=A0ABY8UK28_TETOB|nr:hypothetical protein OEZ85_000881 [Tetradesmus obliquus]
MGHVSRERDWQVLQDERRRMLEHVLEAHKARGGKVQLPIGMNTAEPWLLDAVDVQALLAGLHHNAKGNLDLLQYCRRATRTLSAANSRGRSLTDAGWSAAGGADGDDSAEREAPLLHLPQLNTGLSEAEVKDLAYLVFASNCGSSTDEELAVTVRSQLDVDEARAGEVARLLALVSSTLHKMRDATGSLPVSELWTANLELPVCLLGVVLPKDFNRFRSFVVWRDTLSHVLLSTLAASVRDGWQQQHRQQGGGSSSPSAQQLMARLKASLRRCDVRDADDFDEEEYRAASRAVGEHAYAIIQCVSAGWSFPWGLRVRLCEMLLRGVFDTLDEAAYIEGADAYLQLLQARLWPLLGVSPSMHNAGFAWVHFRQFVLTRHPGLVAKTKALLKRLALLARQHSRGNSGGGSGAGTAGGSSTANGSSSSSAPGESSEDAALTRGVGAAVIDWIAERLADYHARLSGVGGPEALPNLVDVMAFAALARGASQQEVGDMLAAAIRSSVEKELQRRLAAAGSPEDEAEACSSMCSIVKELAREQMNSWASGFSGQLPEAVPLSLAVLHGAAGARLLPWLSSISSLDEETCEALRAAMELEPLLLGPITAAAAGCQHPATRRALEAASAWDVPMQLQPVLAAWVHKQISGFELWVARQLQQESWQPLAPGQPHSASARELRRIVMESLDALFELGLPLPAAVVGMHMEGVDGMMQRYLAGILERLGPWAALVPPLPALTRYKREVAVKQEEAESGMPGLPEALPPPGTASKKGLPFLECVRRTQQEPHAERIEALSPEVLVVMMASLGYLLDTLQPIANTVAEKWQEECRRTSSAAGSGRVTADGSGSGGGARNPFLSPSPEPHPNGYNSYNNTRGEPPGVSESWGGGWGLSSAGNGGGLAAAAGFGGRGSGLGPAGFGGASSAGLQRAEEHFGSMLEAAGQALRGGVAVVTKWLAVRVVWWQQRAGWCELLYRHRVTSCRIDWLLEGLADVLGGPVGLLPRQPRLEVAAALLQEAALGLERALLDGGPCKWFIPADAAHIKDDVDALTRLFFAEGDGLPMQDISKTLAGLNALLKLLQRPTGPLREEHRTARRAALLAGVGGSTAAAAAAAAAGSGYASPAAGNTGASLKQQQLGPLAASRLTGGGVAAAAAAAGPTGSSIYSVQVSGGGTGGNSPRGGGNSPRGSGGGKAAAAVVQQTAYAIAAAGGDVCGAEHVLLKVLCHRADHAASKYLKEQIKVPKARDATIGETFGRLTRLTRL